jgi:hypothetical protein
MPDPSAEKLNSRMEEFILKHWEKWWKLRINAEEKIQWTRSSVRPVNFPERRLAGLLRILEKTAPDPIEKLCRLAEKYDESSALIKAFRSFIISSDPLWDNYYTFTSETDSPIQVIGRSRADDIIINTIFSSLCAYSIITGNQNIERKITEAYSAMPKAQDNRVLKTASMKWFMPPSRQKNIFKNASAQQGAIYLYRSFCQAYCSECTKCPLNTLISSLQFK